MNFQELFDTLENLTNKKFSQSEIAEILDCKRANISKRAKNNSEITVSELQTIENFYGLSLYPNKTNSLDRHFDANIKAKQEACGHRICEIRDKNNLSSFQMAGLLNISEKALPDLRVLNNLKQNFKVSIDWVLYGE